MKLAKFSVSAEEHKKRQEAHRRIGAELKASYQAMMKEDWEDIEGIRLFSKYPHNLILQSDPIFETIPFGPVGTVMSSGCVAFVSAYIIEHYIDRRLEMRAWANTVVEKGYRSWRFENFPKVSFTSREVDLDEVKKKLGMLEPKILKCESTEELFRLTGKPEGIGGSMFLIDNVIAQLSKGNISGDMTSILGKTRISSVQDVISNLFNGYMVPMRVNNSIYHADPARTGGHYVILVGLYDGEAHVLDSLIGFKRLPFRRLIEAALADDGLIACWDLSWI